MKRFTYYRMSQMIKDNATNERYEGNQKTTDLLNQLHEDNLESKEALKRLMIDMMSR